MQVAAVVEASSHEMTAVLILQSAISNYCAWMGGIVAYQKGTHNLLATVPEYLNVLGPSANVNGKGPDISQSSGLGQKIVYVVAVLS